MIVITTMNALPDYCHDCPCNNSEHSRCEADKERRSTFEYRPYWCPLKEVRSICESMAKLRVDSIAQRKGGEWLE